MSKSASLFDKKPFVFCKSASLFGKSFDKFCKKRFKGTKALRHKVVGNWFADRSLALILGVLLIGFSYGESPIFDLRFVLFIACRYLCLYRRGVIGALYTLHELACLVRKRAIIYHWVLS